MSALERRRDGRWLRCWLVAAALLFAQSWALAHAVEHLQPELGAPQHACAQCLAMQGLGAALAAAPPLLPPAVPAREAASPIVVSFSPLGTGFCSARAPPRA